MQVWCPTVTLQGFLRSAAAQRYSAAAFNDLSYTLRQTVALGDVHQTDGIQSTDALAPIAQAQTSTLRQTPWQTSSSR